MDRHVWDSLITVNAYGECAAYDAEGLVLSLEKALTARGLALDIDRLAAARQILTYLTLRLQKGAHEILGLKTKTPSSYPDGWNDEEERLWLEFLDEEFTDDVWETEIMARVFGTDERIWESVHAGWRIDIRRLLPYWVRRVLSADQESDDGAQEEEQQKGSGKIDTYLLEHGTAKQRRAAAKSSS